MSALPADRQLRWVRSLSHAQLVLKAAVALMPLVVLAAAFSTSNVPLWLVALVTTASVFCAVRGETNVGLLLVVGLALIWLAAVDDLRTGWTLLAAVALGVFHVSMAASTIAPRGAEWSRTTTTRWIRRTATVAAITTVAWLLEILLVADRPNGQAGLLLLALAVLAAAALVLRARSLDRT